MIYAYFHHSRCYSFLFFFFNDTATTEIYTLSLHDALPISLVVAGTLIGVPAARVARAVVKQVQRRIVDRKSTRLNSSHTVISYAVFCLKKKKLAKAVETKLFRDVNCI